MGGGLQRRWPWILTAMLAIPLTTNQSFASNPSDFLLEVDQGQTNLHARNVQLSEILSAIADQTGLIFVLDQEADHPLTLEMQEVPLPAALRHLLRKVNYAGIWESRSMGDQPEEVVLVKIYVYPQGKPGPGQDRRVFGASRERAMESGAIVPSQQPIMEATDRTGTPRTVDVVIDEGLRTYQEKKKMNLLLKKKELAILAKLQEEGMGEAALEGALPRDKDFDSYFEKKKKQK